MAATSIDAMEKILMYAGVGFFASMYLMTKYEGLRPPASWFGKLSSNELSNRISDLNKIQGLDINSLRICQEKGLI